MTLVREFDLFLTAGRGLPLLINVNQFDSGEEWHFTLYKGDGTQYIPSTGAIVGIKSDGLGIINSGAVVDGKVVITETQQMTAAPGKAVFELMIDNGTHGTANFLVLVEPKPGNNADLSDSDLSLIQEALDAVSPLPTGGSVGQVLTKTANGSTWSDAGTPTQEQVAEAVSDWADENITVETGVVIDTSLSVAGAAADAKKTGDEISELKSQVNRSGLSDDFKNALYELVSHINGWDDNNSQTYVANLYSAMNPTAELTSITAVYTQSGTVYVTDSLDDLKDDLVVTAHYSDETSRAVTAYTLSGELTNGTNEITVSYGGKTTTFTVTATQYQLYDYIYSSSGNTDYVDTGLTRSPSWTTLNLEFEAWQDNSYTGADGLIGASNTNTADKSNLVWFARASRGGFSTYSLGVAKQLNTVPAQTRAICKYFFVDGGESYLMYNDTRVAVATVSSSEISPNGKSLVLAGTYTLSGESNPYGMNGSSSMKDRLGYVKFSNPSNNEVVYNFVPAQDLISEKYGYYDTVGGVFYPQIGSTLRCANWE